MRDTEGTLHHGIKKNLKKEYPMKIFVNEKEYDYPSGITYSELAKDFEKDYDSDIILAIEGVKYRELFRPVKEGEHISFEPLTGIAGHKSYKRSACMLMLKAFYDVIDNSLIDRVKVEFSIGKAYYCTYRGDFKLDEEKLALIKKRMEELVEEDIPFKKTQMDLNKALERFDEHGMAMKKRLFKYRRYSTVNIYSLNKYEDYYYGYMVPSTGYIKWFDLLPYDEGFMLVLPERKDSDHDVAHFTPSPKLFKTMKESTAWGEMLEISGVAELNDCIAGGRFNDLVLVQEALMEKKIADIAEDIIGRGGRKFIMIAGPSSSGKTSFSHRLSIELRAHGYKPHPIALDNYFKNRADTPLDEFGNKNYECLEALNVELFNQNMTDLLAGKEVQLPTYNFLTGMSEMNGPVMKLGEEDVLVIEGIHGLNDELSYSLPKDSKYKIYISALTTLNVDEHNRIPTTDARLLRRMVRDFRTRGASASKTLDMWASVRRGEDENIFPYQESADVMFNSAHIYELALLKQYAEPLLFGIEEDDPQYFEAKRLLKFLEYFLGASTEGIPNNSIVREFVGGSVFPV